MGETIWKYSLERVTGWQVVHVKGFRSWIDAGVQDDNLVLWALVDHSDPKVYEIDVVIGWTGQPVETTLPPFRTLQTREGLCWHLFLYRGFPPVTR